MHDKEWWELHRKLPTLQQRSRIIAAIRQHFADRNFLEVETPLIAASPGLEVHLKALKTEVSGQERYLVTSPEYHMKRLLAAGAERIYSLQKAFRDDELGDLHVPEFTLLEWYRVGEGPETLMNDVAELVALATGDETRTWHRITVAEALKRWGTPTDEAEAIVEQLALKVEPALKEMGAVFLTDYPACLASLARLKDSDQSISERFEAYVDGVELANGFGELCDPAEQRRRFELDLQKRRELDLPAYPIDERFLRALERGMPQASGIALGVDRLILLALKKESLAEVLAFPPEMA